jgi:hypothetical protein
MITVFTGFLELVTTISYDCFTISLWLTLNRLAYRGSSDISCGEPSGNTSYSSSWIVACVIRCLGNLFTKRLLSKSHLQWLHDSSSFN